MKINVKQFSRREKIVFYASVFFIGLAFLDRMIVNPLVRQMRFLDEEIGIAEGEIKKNRRIISQRPRIEEDEKRYSSFASRTGSDEEETAALLREVETLANANGVYLVDLKPSGIRQEGTVKKNLVNVSCEGQMEQLLAFMGAVERSAALLQTAAFTIAPKSRQSSVARCDLLIVKIGINMTL